MRRIGRLAVFAVASRMGVAGSTLVASACTANTPAPAPAAADEAPAPASTPKPALPPVRNEALLDPFAATETAPDTFKVRFHTTKGEVMLQIHRAWAPRGADRFYNLVKLGFFEEIAFFRVMDGFMVQFGIHGHPEVASAWRTAPLKDDPRTQPNKRGTVSFANRGPNTRTTQLFINFNDHASLDQLDFAPIGEVIAGMEVVDAFYNGYGECAPQGSGPDQAKLEREGNPYLRERFDKLDWLDKAELVQD